MPTAKPAVKPIDYAPYGYASGYTQGNTHDDAYNHVYSYAPWLCPKSTPTNNFCITWTSRRSLKIFHEKRINI
jgi:hypothetical protein